MFWGKYNIVKCLDKAKVLGFNEIEICLESSNFEVDENLLIPEVVKAIKTKCDEQHFSNITVGCHSDYVHNEKNFEFIQEGLKKAHDFGSDVFVLGGCSHAELRIDKQEWYDEKKILLDRLSILCKIAEENDIQIAIEPEVHCIMRNLHDYHEAYEQIGSHSFKLNYDIGHCFLTEKDSIEEIYNLKNRIIHVHFEDMLRGWHNHQLPFKGDMDLIRHGQALKDVGFKGMVALDLYGFNLEEVAPYCLESYSKIINNLS
jgi:sugar phosphate isomerase/epimerase